MTPEEFLETVVRPNVEEFEADCRSVRKAHNAVSSVYALAAQVFHWLRDNLPGEIESRSDGQFRNRLAQADPNFQVLRDLASAQRHYRIERNQPVLSSASQVSVEVFGWDEAIWDETRWDSPPQVYVQLDDGNFRAVDFLVRNGVDMLTAVMLKYGMLNS